MPLFSPHQAVSALTQQDGHFSTISIKERPLHHTYASDFGELCYKVLGTQYVIVLVQQNKW